MSDEKYKDKVIQGSVFPDKPVLNNMKIVFSPEILNEYIPTIEKIPAPKGLKLLCTIMAQQEGFKKGTRSYRTHNPGNIGNTDSGQNKVINTLDDGINLQIKYLTGIINGTNKNYPVDKQVNIPPYYSKEIAAHEASYQLSPWLPGYTFIFTGQLDQFVKIYSTGARATNSYLSLIVSYFAIKGIPITAQTTLEDLSKIV